MGNRQARGGTAGTRRVNADGTNSGSSPLTTSRTAAVTSPVTAAVAARPASSLEATSGVHANAEEHHEADISEDDMHDYSRPPPSSTLFVMCPRCRQVLRPPAESPLFRCPCGQLQRYEGAAEASGGAGGGGGPQPWLSLDAAGSARLAALSARMDMMGLGDADLAAALAVLLGSGAAGAGVQRGASSNAALRPPGTPEALIRALPERKFSAAALPRASAITGAIVGSGTQATSSAELSSCLVCLSDYEEGDSLKTLPCLHVFHVHCIDEWLRRKRLCPLCNTDVEVDPIARIAELEAEAEGVREAASAARSGAAASAATGATSQSTPQVGVHGSSLPRALPIAGTGAAPRTATSAPTPLPP